MLTALPYLTHYFTTVNVVQQQSSHRKNKAPRKTCPAFLSPRVGVRTMSASRARGRSSHAIATSSPSSAASIEGRRNPRRYTTEDIDREIKAGYKEERTKTKMKVMMTIVA